MEEYKMLVVTDEEMAIEELPEEYVFTSEEVEPIESGNYFAKVVMFPTFDSGGGMNMNLEVSNCRRIEFPKH